MDSLNYDLSGKLRHIYAGCNVGEAEWACTRCGREFKEEDGVLEQTTGIKGRRTDAVPEIWLLTEGSEADR
jgi:hypothetical protein